MRPGRWGGRRRVASALAVCAVVPALAGRAASAVGVSTRLASASASSVQITGFGFGHGRGMGQWGAYGYASVYGWGYEQILGHYYGGTTLASLPTEPDITVHITELDGHATLVQGVDGATLSISWAGGNAMTATAAEVSFSSGVEAVYTGPGCAGPWKPVGRTTAAVTVSGGAVLGSSKVDACLPGTGDRIYQGDIVAQPDGQTDNVLPLEEYVEGVVPAESPATWATSGGEAALEAQAVAARSYALASVADGQPICDTTECQMYAGWPDQYGLTADTAVEATAGQVLYCDAGSSCGPAGTIALAEYSASTGGYTAGGAFPAVPDLGDSVAANPVHTWTVEVAKSQLEALFPSIGTFEQLLVTARNGLGQIGGRVETAEVEGSDGSVVVSGAQLATDLGLRSDWFEVDGAPLVTPTSTTATTRPTTTTTRPSASTTVPATTTTRPTTSTTRPTATTTRPTTTTTRPTTTTTRPTASTTVPATTTTTVPVLPPGTGFWVTDSAGQVVTYGDAPSYGTAAGTSLAGQVTGMVPTPNEKGYWLVARDGAVLAFGDAHWYGSASGLKLAAPVVGMAATPNGKGYWLVAGNGGVFAYGNAIFYGSVGSTRLTVPIVGMAATPDGKGYWLVAGNGGVFTYGDAAFYGSMGERHLDAPITGIVPSADGRGYFLVASDGGVFAFGDAPFMGSLPAEGVHAVVAALAPADRGRGYFLVTGSGRVYGFGRDPVQDLGQAVGGRPVAIAYYR